MADEVLSSLVGRISFEVDPKGLQDFNQGMDDARKGTDATGVKAIAFGNILSNVATKAASLGLELVKTAASASINLVKGFIDSGAELDAFARKAGTTTQELQRLEFAGATTGAEADNVREAYKTLTENLGELARVGSGPAVDSLATLGLTLRDFEGKDATEQMGLMADAMQGLPDDAQRVSVALEIMGEDGGALLPLFQKGSRGIEELADKADRLGSVLSEGAVASAVEAKKSLIELRAVVTGVGSSIAAKLVPKVVEVVERIQGWIEQNREMIDQGIDRFIDGLIPAFERLVEVGGSVLEVGGELVDMFGGLEGALIVGATAAAGFALALGGIPAIMAAAVVAIGLGINKLAGFSDEVKRLRKEKEALEGLASRDESSADIALELNRRRREGTLGELSDEEFDRKTSQLEASGERVRSRETGEFILKTDARGETAAIRIAKRARQAREQGEQQRASESSIDPQATARAIAAAQVDISRSTVEARARNLGLGSQAVESALGKSRMSLTEGASASVAQEAAFGTLDSLAGVEKRGGGGRGRGRVNTDEAETMFGDQIRNLAEAAGLGSVAIKASMEAAAGSLKRGASQNVALQAATSTLESLSGRKLAAAGSPDAALFGLLTQIGGAETARSATSGARFVRIDQSVTTNNTITLEIPAQFANAMTADGQAQGIAAALEQILVQRDRTIVDQFGQGHARP